MRAHLRVAFAAISPVILGGCAETTRQITVADYEDKVYAAWLGQCIGNMYGLAHEFKYNDEPRTEPIPGYMPDTLRQIREYNGAFSDDDTDIEYVDLFCMEKYGPEPTYEQITEFWKLCINRYIWVANRAARSLMDQGYLPPFTGRRGINPEWYQIDPQLVCEIWAVTAPGMLDYAAAKADWAAKVTNDQYGTHPTVWYNTMYAAAFFESDVQKLCQIGYEHLPVGSIFREAIDDVRKWKTQHGADWVAVRKKIKEKYHDRKGLAPEIATGHVSALLNGTLGVLALLYGEGDFEKTMSHACMAGYDADNQCATLAGLLALAHGSKSIPRKFTYVDDNWTLPLNDFYKNRTRDVLPDGKLTEMARRTAALGRQLVLQHGGSIERTARGEVMSINAKAPFVAPLEARLYPVQLDVDVEEMVRPEVIGGVASRTTVLTLTGNTPPGMRFDMRNGRMVLAGKPTRIGKYEMTVSVSDGSVQRDSLITITVRRRNWALSATGILSAIDKPAADGGSALKALRDGLSEPTFATEGGDPGRSEDFYGYEWKDPVSVGRIVYRAGGCTKRGGWFEEMKVQYRDDQGAWLTVQGLEISPAYNLPTVRKGEVEFTLKFKPVSTRAVRVIGKPGGDAHYTSVGELEVYSE